YEFENIAWGTYMIRTSAHTLEGFISSAFQQAVVPAFDIDFTLSVEYELGEISGTLPTIAARKFALARAPSRVGATGNIKVELWQGSRKLISVDADASGSFIIPNLLSGHYTAKAYYGNVLISSKPVTLKQGQRLSMSFLVEGLPSESVFNYPNPAKGVDKTTVHFECGYANLKSEVKIYNIAGELVRTLPNEDRTSPASQTYEYEWKLNNDSGKKVASGVYIYILYCEDT
ncbi:unnamed protein product, partial [marine sediment metagenome]